MVMGAGSLGCLFGGLIASAGYKVTLVGREKHVRVLKEHGVRISGLTNKKVFLDASTSPVEADIIIFTVKSYDTETAARELKPFVDEGTSIVSFQNGLGNEEKIGRIVGEKHVIGGITSHGALLKEYGHVVHTGIGETVIGELDGKITDRLLLIREILTDAGIKTEISTDIRRKIWEKLIVNAGINPVTAIARVKNRYLLEEELRWLMEAAVREAVMIARQKGMNISEDEALKKVVDVARNTGENESSMLQDIKKGKKTEIDAINGEIVRAAEEMGVDVPVNKALYSLVKAIARGVSK